MGCCLRNHPDRGTAPSPPRDFTTGQQQRCPDAQALACARVRTPAECAVTAGAVFWVQADFSYGAAARCATTTPAISTAGTATMMARPTGDPEQAHTAILHGLHEANLKRLRAACHVIRLQPRVQLISPAAAAAARLLFIAMSGAFGHDESGARIPTFIGEIEPGAGPEKTA